MAHFTQDDTRSHTRQHVFTHKMTRVHTQDYTRSHTRIYTFTHKTTRVHTQDYTRSHTRRHAFTYKTTCVHTQDYTHSHTRWHALTHKTTHIHTQDDTRSHTRWHTFTYTEWHIHTQDDTFINKMTHVHMKMLYCFMSFQILLFLYVITRVQFSSIWVKFCPTKCHFQSSTFNSPLCLLSTQWSILYLHCSPVSSIPLVFLYVMNDTCTFGWCSRLFTITTHSLFPLNILDF